MTILNQTPIMESIFPVFVFIIATIGAVVSCIIFLCTISCSGSDFPCVMSGLFIIACLIILVASACIKKPSGRYKYECLIDDDTTYTEICDKYNVVEQRGDIWVLTDKEN